MRKLLQIVCFFFFSLSVVAQPYGNEWINYNQKYFYFKIAQTGVYRIDYTTLLNAGFPVATINPKNIQLFGKETEQHIFIQGESDNSFDPGDYIEFYAEQNDGWLDKKLYGPGQFITNEYYSLYNDTLRYYLTWNASTTNKRIKEETDINFAAYSPINFILKNNVTFNSNYYHQGENYDGSSSSFFISGEGWIGWIANGAIPGGTVITTSVNTSDVYTGVGAPLAEIVATSVSASNSGYSGIGNHHQEFNYSSSNIVLNDSIFYGFKLLRDTFTVNANTFNSPNTDFRHRIIHDQGAITDYQAVAFVSVTYPHTLNFSSTSTFNFISPLNTLENKSRLDITGFTGNNPSLYVFGDTLKKITVSGTSGNYQALIPNDVNGDVNSFLFADNSIQNVTQLYLVNGSGDFTDYISNPIDSVYLILTHASLLPEANQYAAYRNTTQGGNFSTLVVDVEELYHQYGGGVEKHALALKRFINHLADAWTQPPSYVFIIGKGIREASEANGSSPGSRKSSTIFQSNLVPTMGYPVSDILLSNRLEWDSIHPRVPIGRIAANDGATVLAYLQKMQDYEAAQQYPIYTMNDKAWMKHILHFGGGSNQSEQIQFASFLSFFESIAEDTVFFGGYVDTYLKTTSSPINPLDFSEISDFLQEGISLMTFFGHASSAGFDQNIDAVTNWNNTGKYPFLLGNGCYAGDIYQPTSISNSEEFTLIPQLGTIGFLSTSKVGFSSSLFLFSDEFYKQFCYKNYGTGVGDQVRATAKYMEQFNFGLYNNNVTMQMALHGDPALKINYHKKPEFVVRVQDVFFDPPNVSLGTDSLNVNVIVTNLGRSSSDSVNLELVRHFPNNNGDSIYNKLIAGVIYRDTIVFRIPVLHNLATGINLFDISVDIPSNVDEVYDELNNNQITATLFINSNGIATIFPYDYAIVPDTALTFKASTFNPISSARDYVFEIDTTDLFNSPFLRRAIINSPGGVVELPTSDWRDAISNNLSPVYFTDSTVYFWRVSPDSTVKIWDESSFQYIKGQTGWGQSHFFQFKNDIHQSINYDRTTRSWIWDETYRLIDASVYAFSLDWNEIVATEWKLDGGLQEYAGCGSPQWNPSIHVAVIDPLTLEAWTTADHNYSNINPIGICRNRPEKYFIYRQNISASMDSLKGFYNNYIPAGHYVLFYTFNYADYTFWTPQDFAFFQGIGADSIYSGRPNEAWIYLTQKGNEASFNNFNSTTTPGAQITIVDTLSSFNYQGNIISEIAGPAARWDALYWAQESKELLTSDSTRIYLIGIKLDGTEDTLVNTMFTNLDSIITLNSIVDANVYPYVKLAGYYFDDQWFTPAQNKRWQLLYQPMPEAAVNPQLGFYFNALNDTLYEGQDMEIAVAIENISPYHMDSLLVHYWVEDENRNLNYLTYPRQDSLRSSEVLYDTLRFNTEGFPGLNSVWVEVNPVPFNSPLNVYDQLEQYHFNNYLQIPFYMERDIINPILDVTFDGIHILNGDIVSGNPFISISLKEENPYLIMNQDTDTSYFAVYLTDPLGNQKRIYFTQGGNPVMTFTPSNGPNDKFKIDYNPTLLVDGKYSLLVQATDKSGNESGDYDYLVEFEVINASTITEVMNYPNPFSTKTHFVFTLTGNKIPDYMKIQIMTVSGKIVREIMVEELGPIRIGRNITEYAWDGRDEFGDQLANGVYLYRVVAKINGESIEKRVSGADEFFHKGFGKMYLMR